MFTVAINIQTESRKFSITVRDVNRSQDFAYLTPTTIYNKKTNTHYAVLFTSDDEAAARSFSTVLQAAYALNSYKKV